MYPENFFCTADPHFDHKAMVERFRTHMGWTSKEEMTDYLIEVWNSVIPARGATVVVLGDVFFCGYERALSIMKRLHGSQIFVIRGNHDRIIDKPGLVDFQDKSAPKCSKCGQLQQRTLRGRFVWVKDYAKIRIQDPAAEYINRQGGTVTRPGYQPIVMSHYPMLTWDGSGRGSWMLHGHCHGKLKEEFVGSDGVQYRLPPAKRLDVGMDCHNFKPLTYWEIKGLMAAKGFQPVDQHGTPEDTEA